MITIDGSMGEGGGQVLRSSLALSGLTGQPFRMHRIRGKRRKPGLMRQHLTCVRAAAEVCAAEVQGASLGSQELTFRPGRRQPGNYRFVIGSAGSTGLVLQTVLPLLLTADGPSTVVIEGGTHNSHSPPFHFLARTFLPLVERMGPAVDITLDSYGFYPAGGGRITVQIEPVERLRPLVLEERGPVRNIEVTAIVANLAPNIGHRELVAACDALGISRRAGRVEEVESNGPGNAVLATCEAEHVTLVFTAFGRRGVSSEVVGAEVAAEARRWLDLGIPVDEHLADQLLLPLAMAGSGSFVTGPPSLHTTTNADVIERFLGVRPRFEPQGEAVRVAL